jgi:hypothetical protein
MQRMTAIDCPSCHEGKCFYSGGTWTKCTACWEQPQEVRLLYFGSLAELQTQIGDKIAILDVNDIPMIYYDRNSTNKSQRKNY